MLPNEKIMVVEIADRNKSKIIVVRTALIRENSNIDISLQLFMAVYTTQQYTTM